MHQIVSTMVVCGQVSEAEIMPCRKHLSKSNYSLALLTLPNTADAEQQVQSIRSIMMALQFLTTTLGHVTQCDG